jgi:hypothetical protein
MTLFRVALLLAAALVLTGTPARAQVGRSLCADCHFSREAPFEQAHLDDWSSSPHGRLNVGCEACHGGNPNTLDRFSAHDAIRRSSNPASPVHRVNLPRTCGGCHSGPFVAFQKSEHFKLLNTGDGRGPTCTTCHDSVAARLASPRGLEQRCNQCHGPNAKEPREGRAQDARAMLEDITEVRESIKAAIRLIARVSDPSRKATLENQRQQAEVALNLARDAVHQFEFTEVRARMANAREQASLLMFFIISVK